MSAPNLILTSCAGYNKSHLEMFFVSLKKHVKNYECIVFFSNLTNSTIRYLQSEGAVLLPMKISGKMRGAFNRYKNIGHSNFLKFFPEKIATALAFHSSPIMSLRFLYYDQFIRKNESLYEKVLITDVRDVVFQADPFECIQEQEVQFFLESNTLGIPGDVNKTWLDWIYKCSSTSFLIGKKIACAGTTLGSAKLIPRYLEAMRKEIINAERFPYGGNDQGMHNMILWRERSEFKKTTIENAQGAVFMAIGAPKDLYKIDDKGFLLDGTGRVVPLLHTYDRFPEMVSTQRNRLGLI